MLIKENLSKLSKAKKDGCLRPGYPLAFTFGSCSLNHPGPMAGKFLQPSHDPNVKGTPIKLNENSKGRCHLLLLRIRSAHLGSGPMVRDLPALYNSVESQSNFNLQVSLV